MKTTKIYRNYSVLILLSICFMACEEYVEIDPPNSKVVSEVVFDSDALATAAVEGIYHQLFNFNGFASGSVNSITVVTGISADELEFYNPIAYPEFYGFYDHVINPASSQNLKLWSSAYNIIYMCNAVLEGLENAGSLSSTTKMELEGETRFVRAFTYFNLVNLYGDVPLITTTDYSKNALASRNSKEAVYDLIMEDLRTTKSLLSDSYRENQRTHPNGYTATALMARISLYLEDWENAENLSSEIIESNDTFELLEDLNMVFLTNSKEAIWQIAPVGSTGETREGNIFIINRPNYFLSPVALSHSLLEAFEEGDARRNHWVSSLEGTTDTVYFPFKYKIKSTIEQPTEYSTVLRLAEQYLIRAEARANQGELLGAQQDINKIRNRAQLPNTFAATPSDLLAAILKERRLELFAERGHRWFDLRRTGNADVALAHLKPNWQGTEELLYPIPEDELAKNPNLNQNPEY